MDRYWVNALTGSRVSVDEINQIKSQAIREMLNTIANSDNGFIDITTDNYERHFASADALDYIKALEKSDKE